MRRIPVYLHAADMISRAGLVSQLRPRPEVLLLDEDELDRAAVAVVVSDGVGEETLQVLRSLRSHGVRQLVLVATHIDDVGLVAAVEIGVAGLLRRADASAERLVSVIGAAAAGDGSVPPDLLGRLLQQVGDAQRRVPPPSGLTFGGLTQRELTVLRLIAEGYSTSEIATRMAYSERTIKNSIHDLVSRFHLRNRTHAVAFAVRQGLI